MAVQIVMAARVAEIKIVRGAECTRLIRKFQCFVASAPLRRAAPPPQSTTPPSSSLLSASVRPSFCAGATGVLDPYLGSGSRVYRGVEHFPTLALCML